MRGQASQRVSLGQGVDPLLLFGHNDANLLAIERRYDVTIVARGHEVLIEGEAGRVRAASRFLEGLAERFSRRSEAGYQTSALGLMLDDDQAGTQAGTSAPQERDFPPVVLSTTKDVIRPKSLGQQAYVEAIARYDIAFCIGPAGTGKTYLAVAAAVAALKAKEVSRIVLTRPAVEAGERLGFLPGDMQEKVDPYLRPLFDALHDMVALDKLRRYMEMKIIEVAPLAYMRGRTLNHAFVILDEAQNTTPKQMKMFLTRLGGHSKAVITGDITQVDLPTEMPSGLIQIREILEGVEGIRFVYLTERDVVRHPLVQEIIKAYDAYNERQK